MDEFEWFGDSGPDDVYTVGDEDINWERVEELQRMINDIEAIEDDDERLVAAKELVAELAGAN